jgi:hypothetical protein
MWKATLCSMNFTRSSAFMAWNAARASAARLPRRVSVTEPASPPLSSSASLALRRSWLILLLHVRQVAESVRAAGEIEDQQAAELDVSKPL